MNGKSPVVTALLIAGGAFFAFDICVALFAYQAGMFRIVKGKEPPPKVCRPSVHETQLKELVTALEKEKASLEAGRRQAEAQKQQAALFLGQAEAEKKMLVTEKEELTALIAQLKESDSAKDVEREKRIVFLAKLYGAMKPQDAVKVLEKMDDTFAAEILKHMKAQVSAQILAKMKPGQAGAVSEELKRR